MLTQFFPRSLLIHLSLHIFNFRELIYSICITYHVCSLHTWTKLYINYSLWFHWFRPDLASVSESSDVLINSICYNTTLFHDLITFWFLKSIRLTFRSSRGWCRINWVIQNGCSRKHPEFTRRLNMQLQHRFLFFEFIVLDPAYSCSSLYLSIYRWEGQVAGSCESDNEPWGSTKRGEFLD
jgi:hypothetical protein